MSVVKPLSSGHTVELALPGSLQVWDPLVVFPLEQLPVKLGALLFSEVGRSWVGVQNKGHDHFTL